MNSDRKTKLDYTVAQAGQLSGCEAAAAWTRLCQNLQAMAEPEAHPPRFNGLLNAVWCAATNETSP